MLPEKFQKQIDRINRFPINQHAKKLLKKEGVWPKREEVYSLQLLRIFVEDERVDLERRLNSDLELPLYDLMSMTTWNPKRMAALLRLRHIDEKPTARELVEELMERVDGLDQNRQI
jgi:hypothetical protein